MDGTAAVMGLAKPSELAEPVRSLLADSSGRICREGGKLFLTLNPETVLYCDDNPEGIRILESIRRSRSTPRAFPQSREELLQQILTGTCPDGAAVRPEQYRLPEPHERCVILFRIDPDLQGKDLHELFSAMIPMDGEDISVSLDPLTTALILDCADTADEEIREYAEAVIGTFESEGVFSVRAGIGRRTQEVKGLRNSCLDAGEALRLGRIYHSSDTVFQYGRQTLERILDCIPEDRKQAIRNEFFSGNEAGKLTEEMLETVREFFRNDLNLTATSRQLFIHRNTLNYRLDKIRKEFGLDLRRFQDAVIFRIISEIPCK